MASWLALEASAWFASTMHACATNFDDPIVAMTSSIVFAMLGAPYEAPLANATHATSCTAGVAAVRLVVAAADASVRRGRCVQDREGSSRAGGSKAL